MPLHFVCIHCWLSCPFTSRYHGCVVFSHHFLFPSLHQRKLLLLLYHFLLIVTSSSSSIISAIINYCHFFVVDCCVLVIVITVVIHRHCNTVNCVDLRLIVDSPSFCVCFVRVFQKEYCSNEPIPLAPSLHSPCLRRRAWRQIEPRLIGFLASALCRSHGCWGYCRRDWKRILHCCCWTQIEKKTSARATAITFRLQVKLNDANSSLPLPRVLLLMGGRGGSGGSIVWRVKVGQPRGEIGPHGFGWLGDVGASKLNILATKYGALMIKIYY